MPRMMADTCFIQGKKNTGNPQFQRDIHVYLVLYAFQESMGQISNRATACTGDGKRSQVHRPELPGLGVKGQTELATQDNQQD